MSSLRTILTSLSAELRSEKVPTRNKAAEQLDRLLKDSKTDVISLFLTRTSSTDISGQELFNSVIEAIFSHSAKIEDSRDGKGVQSLRNKNFVYRGIIASLIDYNLEDENNFLSKSCIFSAFTEGFSTRCAISNFGTMFLDLLERGIYKSPKLISELKVNEYSRILSYLFEVNVGNDETMRFAVLSTIIKTIEIAANRVQIGCDLIEYLPELLIFAQKANMEQRRADVIKLFYLLVTELSVDYHHSVCSALQEQIPVIIEFYKHPMKPDVKDTFFGSVFISLCLLYPNVGNGSCELNQVSKGETWSNTLRILQTIIEKEVREYKTTLQSQKKCLGDQWFPKLAACVTYLKFWNNEEDTNNEEMLLESSTKKIKEADKLENVLNLVQSKNTEKIELIWLAVLSEIICNYKNIVNESNIQQILQTSIQLLQASNTTQCIFYLRIYLSKLLIIEKQFVADKIISVDYCRRIWAEIVQILKSNCGTNAEIIAEQQLLIQDLIANNKISVEDCTALLDTFINNAPLKRNECIRTIQVVLLHADIIGLNKNAEVTERLIIWLYGSNEKVRMQNMIHGIAPIDDVLVADTSVIAVISFLGEYFTDQPYRMKSISIEKTLPSNLSRMLQYKQNKKLICLQDYKHCQSKQSNSKLLESKKKTGLFQNNYNLLMRTLNFEPTPNTTIRCILVDLESLKKIAIVMKSLIEFHIFDETNLLQCPLIKRIGLFLNQLEFQLKSTDSRILGDVVEVVQRLDILFDALTSDSLLLRYLETQPLQELIAFVGSALKPSATTNKNCDLEESQNARYICLKVLSKLCGSSKHFDSAFSYIQNQRIKFPIDLNIFIDLTAIFCKHNTVHEESADWFVDYLKSVFKLYYTNIDIVQRIVQLMPDIFVYVRNFENSLESMFVALESLLKIADKKSYSVELTTNIIECTQLIAQNCCSIFWRPEFLNICLRVVKFLQATSLRVQFAAIKAITAFIDITSVEVSEQHFEFCEDIFTNINWKSLPTTTVDLEQNAVAVTAQVLVSFFVFSYFHKENALQDLAYFCALRKLKEDNLKAFLDIKRFYDCELPVINKPFVEGLLHTWTSKLYPVLKFPYFLFCESKDDFFVQNLFQITALLFIYGKADDIKQLTKYLPKDFLERVFPIAYAFVLPYQFKCIEASAPEYEHRMKNLMENSKSIGMNFSRNKSSEIFNWETVYYLAVHLSDENHFRNIFGNTNSRLKVNWYNISHESFKCCLNALITDGKSQSNTVFESIISNNPLSLLRVVQELQKNCLECLFPREKNKYFYVYCVIADLILDSIAENNAMEGFAETNAKFFIREIIFFVMNYLQNAKHIGTTKNGLAYLNVLLQKSMMTKGLGSKMIDLHLNDICRILVKVVKESNSDDIGQLIIDILNFLIVENKDRFQKAILLLDEFPSNEKYTELRKYQISFQVADNEPVEALTLFQTFLHTNNRGIEGIKALRLHVAKHRSLLQKESDLLYELVSRLIMTVRNSDNWELKNECAMCLGSIGSLQMKKSTFYFHTENSIYKNEKNLANNDNFFAILISVIDEIMLEFKPNTYQPVFDVCQKLVNSVKGAKICDNSKALLNVFRTKEVSEKNYLDTIASCPQLDWVSILTSTTHYVEYNLWICDFMSKVYGKFDWKAFQELSSKNVNFAEASLLPFIRLILENKEQHLQSILDMLEYFFNEFFKEVNANTAQLNLKSLYTDKRIICKFLEICECIRILNNWSIPLNLIKVCEACNFCQAYFMSIMYLELYYLQKKKIIEDEQFQATAIKAYDSIGCTDAVSSFLNPLKSRLYFLSLRNDWSDVLLETSGDVAENSFYAAILKRNGILPVSGVKKTGSTLDYEVCWRLCQWDVSVEGSSKVNNLNDMEQEYQKHHFNALKSLHSQEKNNALAALCNARKCVISILEEISVECLQSVYKYLTWLQSLQQVNDFCAIQFKLCADVANIFEKWKEDSHLDYGSFRFKEEILSHQIALFHTAGIRTNRKILEYYKGNPIETCLLNCAIVCKSAGEINLAKRNIATLRNIGKLSNNLLEMNMLLEDAEICFADGKPEITKAILDFLVNNGMRNIYAVRAIRMAGEYALETNSKTFENVVNSFFKMAEALLDSVVKNKQGILNDLPEFFDSDKFDEFERDNRKKIYASIAKYADREYMQLNTYLNSEEFQTKKNIIQHNREAADSVSKQNRDRDKISGACLLKKSAILDEKEMQSFQTKCIQNLCIAVENYIKFCSIDETASEATIYRIIALWFSNKQNEVLISKIESFLSTIPSYKFICALNQITGRLNSKNHTFLAVLKKLLIRCVQEHPHQTLYKLFPLVFAFDDGTSNKSNDRVDIAKEIILKGKNKTNAATIKQLEIMFPALIEFANEQASKDKTMPLSDKLKKLKNLDAIHCPTINLAASASLQYNIISIIKWNHVVNLVGGINAPKKLSCSCSDGVSRPQLLKGKDDLRQDAVMQQVFVIINNLLASEPETANRKLMVRTYSVVPLSMRSGILEWCEHTLPIGMYLIEAHVRYRPEDYKVSKCRTLSMQNLKADITKRREVYDHICTRIKPVMHYFLLEKFLVPGIWFERRLAYTNSVATNSIIGFILGIGDRHTQNILIDEKTAELIHIDFGIAFEQGKIMPTPETVPFRLTRDVIAPMGVWKEDGIFKTSCEATMQILRRHRNIILTILEVLLYDPLYIWKVLQQKSNSKEPNSSEETNLTAKRTLLCVQNKLEGKQAGILGTSDVRVQVQRLINEAISSHNLCQLFPGWDPYL